MTKTPLGERVQMRGHRLQVSVAETWQAHDFGRVFRYVYALASVRLGRTTDDLPEIPAEVLRHIQTDGPTEGAIVFVRQVRFGSPGFIQFDGQGIKAVADFLSTTTSARNESGLGRARWVVERTFAWLHHYKRCSSATTAATTCTKRSSPSPAASSATGGCDRHSETSS
jgi:hypothetical protein